MVYNTVTQTCEPFAKGKLHLDADHDMFFQQSGNPNGHPVVVLHGGPGAGIDVSQRSVFNPRHYRIIEFDQRGAGQSTSTTDLANNNTQNLLLDIEALRNFLDIPQWLVAGGSWGSLLALLYAQKFPKRINGLLLRGIFLGSSSEIHWYLHGMRTVFPEAWHQFITFLPVEERCKPLQNYMKRVMDDDPEIHHPAAQAWCHYEASCSTLLPNSQINTLHSPSRLLTLARIQIHYFYAGFFISDSAVLKNIERVRAIPTAIVQGRYDMICPIATANKLHNRWPEARYRIIPNAGHVASEPGIRRELTDAAKFLQYLNPMKLHGVDNERTAKAYI